MPWYTPQQYSQAIAPRTCALEGPRGPPGPIGPSADPAFMQIWSTSAGPSTTLTDSYIELVGGSSSISHRSKAGSSGLTLNYNQTKGGEFSVSGISVPKYIKVTWNLVGIGHTKYYLRVMKNGAELTGAYELFVHMPILFTNVSNRISYDQILQVNNGDTFIMGIKDGSSSKISDDFSLLSWNIVMSELPEST